MSPKAKGPFVPLHVAILTVSDTRTRANDTSGDLIQERLEAAGHKVAARAVLKDDIEALRAQVRAWIADKNVDAVITTGGTGLTRRDVTVEALTPLLTKHIPGFGELFRWLSFEEIGTATIESRAFAGVAEDTLVFCLPGSTGACRLGLDKIILPQLNASTPPCNIAEMLPRIRRDPAPK
ncbi:MAG: molybdenum cofactor biosynthesis protein B [Candidatus Muproteobacteria bacterium RBG_16_65_34]|uniref:Molybdenum cofactor biosynthesis protein B n=1 Tax=Candidatus Muproteobacteria bacterium RBG_16_65_34 TaxID=1817760 RepID=A0A1F6TV01_9PROT|nr:MAG: molybdenum cofactor biosynthesis protein B [Candidatus Muproteobacteria bacterium RBG_16_65_34]